MSVIINPFGGLASPPTGSLSVWVGELGRNESLVYQHPETVHSKYSGKTYETTADPVPKTITPRSAVHALLLVPPVDRSPAPEPAPPGQLEPAAMPPLVTCPQEKAGFEFTKRTIAGLVAESTIIMSASVSRNSSTSQRSYGTKEIPQGVDYGAQCVWTDLNTLRRTTEIHVCSATTAVLDDPEVGPTDETDIRQSLTLPLLGPNFRARRF